MGKINSAFDARLYISDKILKEHGELIDEIKDKIKNQIDKDPCVCFCKISADIYSKEELMLIKTYFKFNEFKINYCNNAYCYIPNNMAIGNNSIDPDEQSFYIS